MPTDVSGSKNTSKGAGIRISGGDTDNCQANARCGLCGEKRWALYCHKYAVEERPPRTIGKYQLGSDFSAHNKSGKRLLNHALSVTTPAQYRRAVSVLAQRLVVAVLTPSFTSSNMPGSSGLSLQPLHEANTTTTHLRDFCNRIYRIYHIYYIY